MNKKIFNGLAVERSYEFQNLKEKANPNNLIYNTKLKEEAWKILQTIKI